MKIKNLTLLSLFIGSGFAYDKFFGNVRRAELFEKTDFKVPKITINLNDDDYRKYFLTYKCI